MQIEECRLDVFNQSYVNILNVNKGQSSLIFDSEDSYKFMIIENKTLIYQTASGVVSNAIRKKQA